MMNRPKFTIKIKRFFYRHFEWMAFLGAILTMAMMNPYVDNGSTLCMFERIGVPFCPGHGLGHSVAFIFRGDFVNALEANILGPLALVVLFGRILYLLKQNFFHTTKEYIINE